MLATHRQMRLLGLGRWYSTIGSILNTRPLVIYSILDHWYRTQYSTIDTVLNTRPLAYFWHSAIGNVLDT